MTGSKHLYRLPIYLTVLAGVLMVFALALDWMGVEGVAALEYCEALRDRWIRQPANSWSNLGFIAAGWVIAIEAYRSDRVIEEGPFNSSPYYPIFFATVSVLLGIGSFAYHASTTHLGGYLDAGSMYLLSSFMMLYALKRISGMGQTSFLILFLLAVAFSFAPAESEWELVPGIDGHAVIFGSYLILFFILELWLIVKRRISINTNWMLAFSITFIVSFIIWYQSRTGAPWCDPSSLLQGHAVWHLLDAGCVYFIYRYYRSEK